MFVAGSVIALYFLAYFQIIPDTNLTISSWAVIVAAVSFLLSAASYLWTPENRITEISLLVYLLFAATAGTLVATSGGLTSPFVALWMLLAIFGGIFGLWGMLAVFIAGSSYLILSLADGAVNEKVIIITVVTTWLPIIASYVIWHSKGSRETSKDKAYHELANELSEVAGKSEVVINAIGEGVVAVDNKGIIQLINPAAQQITGWGKQDATTLDYKSVLKLVDSKEQEVTTANDPVYKVLETNKETATDALALVTHSGKKIFVSVVVSPIGQLGAGAIIVFRDVTIEKREEREQAEFISTASHEMRTPVASIEGYLGLALNPNTATIDDKARDFITKAHESAQHLGRLFQDLLDVSKAEDGRISNNPKVVDVVQFANTIIEGLRPQADAKQLRLLFKPMPDGELDDSRHMNPVFYANVDNDHLREIIANLTENAIKYTLKGDVVIDIDGDSEHVVISVADSGIGIPNEDIPHLFQKFYRVDNTDTRTIGGTGLGLYLCRRLADVLGGRVWVESQLGKGSTFYLEIPRIDNEEANQLIESSQVEVKPQIISETRAKIQDIVAPPAQTNTGQQTLTHGTPLAPEPAIGSTVTSPNPQIVAEQLRASVPPVQAPPRPNTPLSSLEANPAQYTRQNSSNVTVPVRQEKP